MVVVSKWQVASGGTSRVYHGAVCVCVVCVAPPRRVSASTCSRGGGGGGGGARWKVCTRD